MPDPSNAIVTGEPEPVRKAIILAAGVGDRLRPFTDKSPKCLAKVAGVPILKNALTQLAAIGVKEVAIVVGHHKEIIIAIAI